MSAIGRTVVPTSTVLTVPPWKKMTPSIQATSFAVRGPRTKRTVMNCANACAAPVFDHMPISPPSSHRYRIRMPAELVDAREGMSTSPVRSYWPRIRAPETMPPSSDVTGSLLSQHRSTATNAGSSDQTPQWRLPRSR